MHLNLEHYKAKNSILPPVAFSLLASTERNYFHAQQIHAISRWSALTSGTRSSQVEFSHSLVRSAENEWNIIENTTRGVGGFGSVRPSKFKIILNRNKKYAEIQPTNDVVKIQQLPYNTLERQKRVQDIHKEAQHQRDHYVNVKNVVTEDQQVFIVTEDCGTSLDQLSFQDKPFDYCLQVALCILNEMIILEQKQVIHRDLKPQNICLKFIEKSSEFKVIFIDFGLADAISGEKNKEHSGTALYMAPELFVRNGKTTVASDIYALAGVLGYVFGASDVLAQKKRQANPAAPFQFDDLGQRVSLPPDVESPDLMQDIKEILNCMQKKNPKERPDLEFINKFFIAIPQRRELYKQHLADIKKLKESLQRLEETYNKLGYLKAGNNRKNCLGLGFFKERTTNIFQATFLREKTAILRYISNLPKAKSHYQITRGLYEQEKSNSDYGSFNPFASLDSIKASIHTQAERLEILRSTFMKTESKIAGSQFLGTNSSGILQIRTIIRSDLSLFDKLAEIQRIGREKTQKFSFSYWYSRSSIFGRGRHENVEQLYQKLASLEKKTSEQENLDTLNEINQFINTSRSFVHN